MKGESVKSTAKKEYKSPVSTKPVPTCDREAEVLDRLTKKLQIQLDAIKRSETITTEMLNRRITI